MRSALATRLLQREGDVRRILLEEGAGVVEALKAIRGPLFGLFLRDRHGRQQGRNGAVRAAPRKPGALGEANQPRNSGAGRPLAAPIDNAH